MLTITLPKEGFKRRYETPHLRGVLTGGGACMRIVEGTQAQYTQRRYREYALGNAEQVVQTWASDDTEVVLTSGRHPLNTAVSSQYWLSPRPVESPDWLLGIAIAGEEGKLYLDVYCVGDGEGPATVRIDGIVVGAPPLIIPVGFNLDLYLNSDAEGPKMAVCPDCECFHPRPADCPGPAVK